MIKNLFIPEKIGQNYFFAKRVVGFDIGKFGVRAAVLYFKGKSCTIESLIEEILDPNPDIPYQEKVINAIKDIVAKIGKVDEIISALPSSPVIFKEMKVNLRGLNKIKLILPFELEGQLPFAVDQAVVDCVVIDENLKDNTTSILVAAVKKEVFDEHISFFTQAGIMPDKITVDLFEIYGLYKSIPEYSNILGTVCLLEIGSITTNIIIILDGKLKYIRSLPKGLNLIAKNISSTLNIESTVILENILRFGFEGNGDQKFDSELKVKFSEILAEISFTLENYTTKNKLPNVSKIILFGQSEDIKGIASFISSNLIETQEFNLKNFFNKSVLGQFVVSVSTAYNSSITHGFNLLKERAYTKINSILNKQLIVTLSLTFLILSSFLLHSYLTYRKLKNEINESEKQAISLITKRINIDKKRNMRKNATLKEIIEAARATLEKEESIWFALSSSNRYSFLKYLQEITTKIDRDAVGLDLKKLRIYNVDNSTKIDLEGRVKDFDAISTFETQLRSGMFEYVPRIEQPDFNITLVVKKEQ